MFAFDVSYFQFRRIYLPQGFTEISEILSSDKMWAVSDVLSEKTRFGWQIMNNKMSFRLYENILEFHDKRLNEGLKFNLNVNFGASLKDIQQEFSRILFAKGMINISYNS